MYGQEHVDNPVITYNLWRLLDDPAETTKFALFISCFAYKEWLWLGVTEPPGKEALLEREG